MAQNGGANLYHPVQLTYVNQGALIVLAGFLMVTNVKSILIHSHFKLKQIFSDGIRYFVIAFMELRNNWQMLLVHFNNSNSKMKGVSKKRLIPSANSTN